MAIYAIGDIQGCYYNLRLLLDKFNFSPEKDKLWLAGDVVNRGPDSLKTIRFIKSLGKRAITVLGNHDLTLLAIASGHKKTKHHTLNAILNAPDAEDLIYWLRHQKILHHDNKRGYTMTHAGIYPSWDLKSAQKYANEVETILRSDNYQDFFAHMYGNMPNSWSEQLTSWNRLRFITNAFTRMRYCDSQFQLNFSEKHTPGNQNIKLLPWYEKSTIQSLDNKILFGHWSTLGGLTGRENMYALDTGCLWGGALTAIKLGKKKHKGKNYKHQFYSINCAGIV